MIKREEVEYMAKLARIDLDENEMESLRGDLSDIIGYIDKMKDLDISGVTPSDHSIVGENVTRDDIDIDYGDKDGLIDDFTEKERRYLKVRTIL